VEFESAVRIRYDRSPRGEQSRPGSAWINLFPHAPATPALKRFRGRSGLREERLNLKTRYVKRRCQSPMFCLPNTTNFESVIAMISPSLSPRV